MVLPALNFSRLIATYRMFAWHHPEQGIGLALSHRKLTVTSIQKGARDLHAAEVSANCVLCAGGLSGLAIHDDV